MISDAFIHWLFVGLLVYALILVLAYPIVTHTRFPFCKGPL